MPELVFLGTGTSQGVPLIGCTCFVCLSSDSHDKRLRSSVWIRSEQSSVVIDTGPDFRYQMLRAGINKLDAIVFTHGHKDHTAGFDDIRAFNYIQRKDMNVYCDRLVEQLLHKDFNYVFEKVKYPGVPQAHLHIIESEPFAIGDLPFLPVKVWHLHMPVLGFRIGDLCYITDANRIDEEEKDKIKGCKTLILNALRREKHVSHFNLEEAMELARELEAERCYFTHISHQLGKHEEINKELPEGFALAYDGLTVPFSLG